MAIDIGNKGGIAWNQYGIFWIVEMPSDTKEKPDPNLLMKRWKAISLPEPSRIVAENVHAFAGQGIVSTGTLLKNRGQVEMAAAAVGAFLDMINPLSWIECYTMKRKKHFKLSKEDKKAGLPTWKQHLVEIAHYVLPPDLDHSLVNERTADAILIWNFYAAKLIGKPLKKMGSQLSFKL